jgi:hypothetical protein
MWVLMMDEAGIGSRGWYGVDWLGYCCICYVYTGTWL